MSNILKDAIKLNLMRSPLGHKGVKVLIKGKEWHINESLKYENGGLSVFFVCVWGGGGSYRNNEVGRFGRERKVKLAQL